LFDPTVAERVPLGHLFEALKYSAVNKSCPLVMIDDGVLKTPYPDSVIVGNVVKIVFADNYCVLIVTAVFCVKSYNTQTPCMYDM
jgi:hypothetical protein